MTHAEIAANARKPYADKIAQLMREREQLIAALQDAEFLLRKARINPNETLAMADSFQRCAEDARAAIAKATGEYL